MQDAFVGNWAQESHLSAEILGSLRDLNHRFLDLTATRSTDWVAGRVAPLSAAQRAEAASCPYALFDLRFQDDGYWRARLRAAALGGVAEGPAVDGKTLEFARLALF